jgi:uncharacterized protein YhdP
MTRHVKIALEAGAAGFALVALVAILVVLRLASGPLPLDAVAPYLAAALSNPATGVSVGIDHAFVALGEGPRLELVARGVALRSGVGGPQIALPELAVDLRFASALRGVIAPTRIILRRPQLHLTRDKAGSFQLGFGADEAAQSEASLGQLLRDLAAPPDANAPLGSLGEIAIRRAGFLFDDQALGVVWRAGADLVLRRDASGLTAKIALAVTSGGKPSRIDGEVDYIRSAARLDAQLAFSDLVPASWAGAAPALAPLAALDLPISGTVRATLDSARVAIVAASCDLRLGAGTLRAAELPQGAVAIEDGTLAAGYEPATGRVVISRATLGLDGPRVSASGTIDGVGGGLLAGAWPRALDVALGLEASDVPVASLPLLWPLPLATDARRWTLDHVRAGLAERATAQLGLHVDLAAPALEIHEFTGTIAYRGVALDDLGKLPPVRGIGGTAHFDRTSLTFTPTGGAVLGMRASDATITLDKLDIPVSRLAIALALAGPVKDALVVFDALPLSLRPGVAMNGIAGDFTARVGFALPLTRHLDLRQSRITVDADLSGVSAPHVVLGRDLSAGAFRLRLDRDALQLDGKAALAGVPVALTVRQSLAANAAERTQATLHVRLDGAERRALGVDFLPEILSGTVGVDLAYTAPSAGAAQARLALDLNDGVLALPALDWRKPAGTPATAELGLVFQGARIASIGDATITGGGLRAQLSADFAADGETLARVEVAHLALGATDANASAVRQEGDGWRITLSGRSFDATALMDEFAKTPPAGAHEPPLELSVKLDRLILGTAREAAQVRAELVSDGVHWQAASIDAALPGGAPVRLRYGMVAAQQRFDLQTADFGGLLHLLGLSDNVKGGWLQLAGTAIDAGPIRRLKLTADGADYRIIEAPLLARLLSLASFSGMGAMLSGEGIPFSRLKADLVYGEDRIVIDDFRSYGGAIGITASGTVDRKTDALDLAGTLVPAYRLNSVLGNIPVLGNLLLGGEGQGIFGANFRVAGTPDDPRIALNPLSALAPGVLRKLFLFAPGNPAAAAAAPPSNQTTR